MLRVKAGLACLALSAGLAGAAAAAGSAPGASPPAQADLEEDDTPRGGLPVPPERQEQVRRFLEGFIDPRQSPQEQAARFTARADYYEHGFVGRDEIERDVERHVREWPQRRYTLASIDDMSADPESDRIFVSYTVDFQVSNDSRAARGQASYGVVIKDVGGEPRVESIKEKVHRRRAGSKE